MVCIAFSWLSIHMSRQLQGRACAATSAVGAMGEPVSTTEKLRVLSQRPSRRMLEYSCGVGHGYVIHHLLVI